MQSRRVVDIIQFIMAESRKGNIIQSEIKIVITIENIENRFQTPEREP
ncbi:hypothetical protein pb186bvf_002559 [Paramecium bursaria]